MSLTVGLAEDLFRVTHGLLQLHTPTDVADPAHVLARTDGTRRFVMGVLEPGSELREDSRRRIQSVLDDPEKMSLVFQPVVDLSTGQVVAAEALSRFSPVPLRPPDQWFDDAEAVGMGIELEMLAIKGALRLSALFPDGIALTVNASPSTLISDEFHDLVAEKRKASLVIELTEHSRVDNYEALVKAIAGLRRRGVLVAVDDAGAGFSGLRHILKVAPDFIKLDRDLVQGIDFDPVRRALA